MIRIDPKRLNERETTWIYRATGEVIDISEAWAKSDEVIAERAMEARLLAVCSAEGERRWYALRTGKANEIDLRDWLVKRGVDAVVPEKEVRRGAHNGRRGQLIHKPVLRSLVFVNIPSMVECFAGLLRVRGVAAIIGSGETPHPIRDRDMNAFMDLAQAGAFDERNTPTGLKVGSRVKISVGAYADFEGVLQGYAGSRSARVLTHLFGGEIIVDVKLAHLSKPD